MPHVVTDNCHLCRFTDCVAVCPVECFHSDEERTYIDPDVCIDCGDRGEIKRLAVFMPPGSAKSTYGSILFPPYVMANAPKRAILAASHTTELAEKWGRRIRNLIAGHSATLGVRLSDDSPHAEARMRFRNYYICPCGTEWSDVRSATCDDRCPSCDRSCFSRRERGLICRHGRNLAGRIER
jgi:hypothetical protein